MENNPKSQVVERLREAQNVLVTVSSNPSVDQLSAAIGFTLMMNKLGKHATAVFSGTIPSTLEFLKPEDTLETNTDSLRDFIISLDKAKADKLRYKVEEDVVKIFITPYKTSLSDKDLDFSQGDFNVDVVIALGVDQREHIDQAIISHGRILHDATVIGVMAGDNPVDLGSINWQDPTASSLCEMLVSISEAFQTGMLDGQMATAYLTGIVAETERFSNAKTSPKVMTMSAQLMAAGANQQLIATKLSIPTEVDDGVPADLPSPNPEELVIVQNDDEGMISLHEEHVAETAAAAEPAAKEFVLEPLEEIDQNKIDIDDQGKFQSAEDLAKAAAVGQTLTREDSMNRGKTLQPLKEAEATKPEYSAYMTEPPQMGGTLTASTMDDEMSELSSDPLSGIPQSSYPESDIPVAPMPLLGVKESTQETLSSDSADIPTATVSEPVSAPEVPLGPDVSIDKTLAEIESSVQNYTDEQAHHDEELARDAEAARQAVLDAMAAGGYDENRPEPIVSLGAQPLSGVDDLNNNQPPVTPDSPPPSVPPPFPLPDEDGNLPPSYNS